MATGMAVLCILIAAYAVLAVKLGQWSITMPMVFVLLGFVLGPGVSGLLPISPGTEGVMTLTEITLALILFADAPHSICAKWARMRHSPCDCSALGCR